MQKKFRIGILGHPYPIQLMEIKSVTGRFPNQQINWPRKLLETLACQNDSFKLYLIAVMTETSPTPCLLVNWDEPDSLRKEHDASDQEHPPQPPEHKKTAPWDESGQWDGGKNYGWESHWSRLCARLCCVLNADKIIGLFLGLVIVKIRVVLNLHWVGRHWGWTAMWLDNLRLPQTWSTIPSPCPYGTFRIHQPRKVLKWFWPFLKLATNFTRIELLEAGLEGGAWTWWWEEEEHRQADQSPPFRTSPTADESSPPLRTSTTDEHQRGRLLREKPALTVPKSGGGRWRKAVTVTSLPSCLHLSQQLIATNPLWDCEDSWTHQKFK